MKVIINSKIIGVRLLTFASVLFFSTLISGDEEIPRKLADLAAKQAVGQSVYNEDRVQYQEGFIKGFRSALVNNSPYLMVSNGHKIWEVGFKLGRTIGLSDKRPDSLKKLILKDFGFEKLEPIEGFIYMGFEQTHFYPLRNQELWWIETKLNSSTFKLLDETQAGRKNYKAVYGKVEGWLSPPGDYGHMGCCQHEIFIENVLELRRSSKDEQDKKRI
ncbi:MAG: hypothetical protein WCH62_07885 [Candidatus Omnitrophota bacterium]